MEFLTHSAITVSRLLTKPTDTKTHLAAQASAPVDILHTVTFRWAFEIALI